ncbi:MAG TPA: flagellar biosynthesis anti-sigma factor FlgM [Rhodocyclaceae bacterium]|nr:flagellar biosynthesis anti-sigma factor FlgM [Rhodocyclaceae bacterium]HMV52134.1 flagellar biosynthesis anti-sigma factor FlgM [Rhodocyclaceae bacterium]HMZ82960.1 flagellar biosynthesis anti-sigma factor FlgM [Rhodocyclaceae bacterium]HNA03072.1 flagellar biosynthesis anti-sigma factor FlgM [Rhodocyclaceae bacterium]HNB76932.1 flagellar biosynthesis anti-sigma factor FlgM [Rhodocyclaceae bacterium]
MKIDNSVNVGGLPISEPKGRSVKGQPASKQDASVESSSLSSRLAEIQSSLSNVPVVDSAKVEEIKQAISEGRFKVNAEKVADSLIESVRQMLGSQVSKA